MPGQNCPNRRDLLAYLVGRLSDDASEALAQHLDTCEDCQSELATLDDLDDTLVARLQGSPSPDIDREILDEPECHHALNRAQAAIHGVLGRGDETVDPPLTDPTAARTIGEYTLIERIGQGGMGKVYKARQANLDRIVAVKLLTQQRVDNDKAVARFYREMKAVGQLDHRHIIRAYEARVIDGQPVLAMEYVEGLELSALLKRCGRLPIAAACELMRQTAVGLQYAHQRGMVHRDIKPSNLMLSVGGTVKILDMGLALLCDEPGEGDEMTGPGQPMGTPHYMAPEQVKDSHHIDIRADIYSLGCTLYKLLCDRTPFAGPQYRGEYRKMEAQVHDAPPPIRDLRDDVPVKLAEVIHRMLAKTPADRYREPAEVAAALEPFAADSNLTALLASAGVEPVPEVAACAARPSDARERRPAESLRRLVRSGLAMGPWPTIAMGLGLLFCLAALAGVTIWIRGGDRDIKLQVPDGSTVEIQVPPPGGKGDAPNGARPAVGGQVPSPSKLGWTRRRYDLGGTSFYPHPTQKRTGDGLEKALWTPDRILGNVSHVATGDLTGDGYLEIVLRDADTVAVFDRWGKVLWRRSPVIDSGVLVPAGRVGKVSRPGLADFDRDGVLEVFLFTGSVNPDGWSLKAPQHVIVYGGNGRILKKSPVLDGGDAQPDKCFDFNGDGRIDIVFHTGTYRHPHAVCIYDFEKGLELFRADFADGAIVAGVRDVNGDGSPEMLLTQDFDCHVDPPVADYDSDHCYATLFDLNGKRLWKTTFRHLVDGCVVDMDGDGRPEIILHHELPTGGSVHLLDPQTGEATKTYPGLGPSCNRCWSVADLTGDGNLELVIGDGQQLHVIDANMQPVSTALGEKTWVAATNDLNGDGHVEVIVWQGADLVVLRGDLTELARWTAPGRIHEAIVTDIEGDGVNEVILRAGEGEAIGLETVHFAPLDFQASFDAAEPTHVIRAFLAAVRADDVDQALGLVAPANRTEVRHALKKGETPVFPADVRFSQRVHVNDAIVDIHCQPRLQLTMQFVDDRWWVTRIARRGTAPP